MQRVLLFFFLTLVVPAGIYWASHGFEKPGRGINRFVEEVHALAGGGSAPAPETGARDEKPQPDKEPKENEGQEKDRPGPDKKNEEEPKDTGPSPIEKAQQLYDTGKFAQAAKIFVDIDEKMHALALLGAALAQAFPANLPDGPYYVVTSTSGGEFEGFLSESAGLLRLTTPGGRSLSLPADAISGKRRLDRPKAIERLARRITAEGASRSLRGPRLFALLQEALSMGRPDVAAPLLARVLEIDEEKPFFLSSVRHRVPQAHHQDLYRALGRCATVEDDGPVHETVNAHAPKQLGNGTLKRKPRRTRSTIRSKQALALVRKAGPHRAEGAKLHKETIRAGLDGATTATIDNAVRELEKAIAYYNDALEHEDNNEIHVLRSYCSKLAFQLRFWREQVDGK